MLTRCFLLAFLTSAGCQKDETDATDATDATDTTDGGTTQTGTSGSTATTGTDTGTPPAPETGHWTWSNPLPQGAPIDDVQFTSDTTAFAVTAGGGILRTTDAGTTWLSRYAIQDQGFATLNGMSFVDDDHGWVVGRARILHTDDGAASWVDQTPKGFVYDLFDVAFTSPSHGVAVGATGRILVTHDGGENWDPATHPAGSTFFRAVAFASDKVGWAGGDDGTAVATTDGGDTWELLTTTFDDDIQRASPAGTGVAFATRTEVHVWNGTGWTRELTADTILDLELTSLDDGLALYADGGDSVLGEWTAGTLSTTTLTLDLPPQAVARRAGRTLLGGWWGSLYATDDGTLFDDARAKVDLPDDAQLLDVSFAGDRGVAVGFEGLVVVSDDRGESWSPVKSGITTDLRGVWLLADGTAVTLGYDRGSKGFVPRIWHSTDHGASWSESTVPVPIAYLNAVALWEDGRGLAVGGIVGEGELILITEDGGETWAVRAGNDDTAGFVDVWAVGKNKAWLGAGFGDVVLTENGGQSFVTVDSGTTRAFEAVHFVDELNGWAATRSQDVLRTTDGGHEWTAVVVPATSFTHLAFGSATVGIALHGGGGVYGTTDGGDTWVRQASGWSSWAHPRAVAAISERDLVIVGTEAKALYSRDAGGLVPTTR